MLQSSDFLRDKTIELECLRERLMLNSRMMTENTLKKITNSVFVILFVLFLQACGSGGNATPQERIEKAKIHLENNQVMEAVIELKNALQDDANFPEGRWLLGQAYLKLGNGALSYREFNSAQSLGYTDPEMENNLLRALALQGKHQDVLDKTAQISTAKDVPSEILVIRGNAFLALRNVGEAEATFKKLSALDPGIIEGPLGLAKVALARNDLKLATEHLDKALAISNSNVGVWTLKGLVSLISQEVETAEKNFSRAVALAPYDVSAYIGLVRSQLALDKKEEAKKHLEIIEKYNNNIPIVRYFRAYLKHQESDTEGAKSILLDVLRVVPEQSESILLLSNILYQEGKTEQVIDYLSKFNKRFPLHVPAAKLLSVSYVSSNEPDKAVSALEKARPASPEDSQLLALLGSAYLRTGNLIKGEEYLQRASELSPDAAEIKTQLALSHLASGSTEQAVSELETALELDPDLYSADVLLILSHLREKKHDEAAAAANKLIAKDPDSSFVA